MANTKAADKAPATEPAAPAVEPEAAEQPKAPRPFMSEGMRQDLVTSGHAADPVSGARYTLDREAGVVTITDRSGEELDMFEWTD